MGGAVKSAGGFLGLSNGPNMSAETGNSSLGQLQDQNRFYLDNSRANTLAGYGLGNVSSEDAIQNLRSDDGQQQFESQNALATGPLTGSRFATDQVQNNPILGQLFGKGGELSNSIDKEQSLQNQGFSLQPQDIEAYGQTSGNIARMFGQNENALSQSLASRGLASAPSGAAGAGFTGLQGNKNEQLANAQMQIANDRMNNTMQRIGQQQNFIGQLGGQAQNAIQSQYGRQLSGAQQQRGGLTQTAQLASGNNATNNAGNLGAANYNSANAPQNFMDFATAGMGQGLQAGTGGAGQQAAKSLMGGSGGSLAAVAA